MRGKSRVHDKPIIALYLRGVIPATTEERLAAHDFSHPKPPEERQRKSTRTAIMVLFAHPVMGDTTEARQRALYAYIGVFTPLATLVVSLRLYIRIKTKLMGPEDYVIMLTWVR